MRLRTQYRGREQVLFETLERKYRIWNKTKADKNPSHGGDKTKQRFVNLQTTHSGEYFSMWTQKHMHYYHIICASMLAAVLAKQKKNNETFMANIKRVRSRVGITMIVRDAFTDAMQARAFDV